MIKQSSTSPKNRDSKAALALLPRNTSVMDKISNYNITIPYQSNVIWYNTLRNSMLVLAQEEYDQIDQYLKIDICSFQEQYPELYDGLKDAGFIVSEDFDELSHIKLMNKLVVYDTKSVHLTINPTLDCNLKCWYCSTEYAQAKHHGGMSKETVEAIKRHIQKLIIRDKIKALHLDWFGGEPLMYFYEVIKPITEYAKVLCEKNDVSLTQHATTNSVLMTPEMISIMNNLGLNSFQIPLDGNKPHHDSIKYCDDKTGTFDTIISNINSIADNIDNVHVTLRINYDKKTLYGVEDVIPLISEQAKSIIRVDFQKVWQIKNDEKDVEQLKKVKENFRKAGLTSDYWAYNPIHFNRCYSDRLNHYAINYDGRVFKCTAQDYGDDKVMGIIQEDGDIEWRMKYISKLFSFSTFENERCLACKYLPLCMGPCIIRNYEARTQGFPIPCVFEAAQFPFNSYVIEEAKKRNLID